MADEGDAPVRRAHLARGGLRGVVQQRPPAHRLAARELVGQRLGEQRGERRAMRADGELGALACWAARRGQLDRAVEHLERVLVDVGVVEGALLDAAQRGELGKHHRERAHRRDQLEPGARGARWRACGAARRRRARPETAAERRRMGPRAPRAPPRRARSPSSTATRTSRSTRSGSSCEGGRSGERAAAARAGPPPPPSGSIGSPPASGSAIALTVKSRSARSLLERRRAQRLHVDLPAAVARDHAPGAELLREREAGGAPARRARRPARRSRDRRRRRCRSRRVSRPSSASRTAPPTSQAGLPASASRAASSPALTLPRRRPGPRPALASAPSR